MRGFLLDMTDDLRRFATRVRIAHHIPGRVRFKLSPEAEAGILAAEARSFTESAVRVEGIRSVSVNPLARSCVVEYDPGLIPPSAWRDLVDGIRSVPADSLLRALAESGPMAACG